MLKSILKDVILKRMLKNASVVFGGRTVTGLMGLASISLAARTLGAEQLGIFAMIQAYIVIADKLLNFQCWQAVIKFGADFLKQDKKENFKSLAKFCTILDFATAVIGTVLAAAIIYFFGNWKGWHEQTIYAVMIYSMQILFNLQGTPIGLLRLFDKFRLIAASTITAATLKLILSIFGYLYSGNLMVFVIIWLAASIVESVFLLVAGWRQINKAIGGNFLTAKLSTVAKDKNLWKFMLSTNLDQSVRLASREMDTLIIGAMLGAAATGIYKIARQFTVVLAQLVEPVYQAIYPEMSHLAAEKRFIELKHIAVKTAVTTGGATLLVWLAFVFFGKFILNITAGAEYVRGWSVMIVYMFAYVIWGFSFPLPVGLLAMGKAGMCLLGQIIALAVFLPSLYLLIINFGLIGATAAQIVFFAVYAVFTLLFFVKYISRANLC
jgi:O-antigen/teichoic acid export membrane protein